MKIYISADIEGVTGIGHWDETEKSKPGDYSWFQKQMTLEVRAAAEAAFQAGAQDITIKDAHDSGRNLILDELPEGVEVIRGWAGHPLSMVQGIDGGYDAVLYIGYHSRAGSNTNVLAHTMSSRMITRMTLNGQDMSEFYFHALAASYYGVPSVFLSGDAGLCAEVAMLNPAMETVTTIEGVGRSVVSRHPVETVKDIRAGVARALARDLSAGLMALPDDCRFQIEFKQHGDAYRASFYPGAQLVAPHVVQYTTQDYFEVLRFAHFAY